MDALPSLTVDGFTTNKSIIMVKVYEHFLCSEYSQSNTFIGEIGSLKYILAESTDAESLQRMCIETLDKMYSKYFKTVVVDVISNINDSSIQLQINIRTIDYDGQTYSLNEIIDTIDNKIKNMDFEQESYYA